MMNFFSAFSVKYQTQNPSPSLFILGVPLASLSLPRVTGDRYSPQQWSLLENQKSNQIRGVPAPNGLHFHCQGKQFCFLSILPPRL